jgi:hypothetical protein
MERPPAFDLMLRKIKRAQDKSLAIMAMAAEVLDASDRLLHESHLLLSKKIAVDGGFAAHPRPAHRSNGNGHGLPRWLELLQI